MRTPVARLLRAQLADPIHAIAWQLALGEAVQQFPPMDSDPFTPHSAPGVDLMPLPSWLCNLWSRPFQPDQQVELKAPRFFPPSSRSHRDSAGSRGRPTRTGRV